MDKPTHFIGIDPGKTGAIARWTPSLRKWLVLDMPTVKITRRSGTKKVIDHQTLAAVMAAMSLPGSVGCVEEVASRTGQGVVSVFDFGLSYGAARQALASAEVPFIERVPQVWKRYHCIPAGADKEFSRELAILHFPAQAALLSRKKDNGRAEAMLIAEFLAGQYGVTR